MRLLFIIFVIGGYLGKFSGKSWKLQSAGGKYMSNVYLILGKHHNCLFDSDGLKF